MLAAATHESLAVELTTLIVAIYTLSLIYQCIFMRYKVIKNSTRPSMSFRSEQGTRVRFPTANLVPITLEQPSVPQSALLQWGVTPLEGIGNNRVNAGSFAQQRVSSH